MLSGHIEAEQRSAPWDSDACNDTCRWWMSLGGKPAADIKPPGSSPALSAKAIVPDADLATVMKSLAAGDKAVRTQGPGRPAPAPVLALLPPERPAFIPGQSLWGVRIQGSAPVLPAALLTSP